MSDIEPTPPPTALVIAPGVWIERAALRFSFSRSSGPGGQSVNKVATQAQLRVSLGSIDGLDADAADRLRALAGQKLTAEDELLIQSDTHRSQRANRRACEERLRALVAEALTPPKTRKPSRPTKAMVEKRLDEKRRQSQRKRSRSARKVRGGEDMEE